MRVHGADAQHEGLRHLRVGAALGHERQHLELAGGQTTGCLEVGARPSRSHELDRRAERQPPALVPGGREAGAAQGAACLGEDLVVASAKPCHQRHADLSQDGVCRPEEDGRPARRHRSRRPGRPTTRARARRTSDRRTRGRASTTPGAASRPRRHRRGRRRSPPGSRAPWRTSGDRRACAGRRGSRRPASAPPGEHQAAEPQPGRRGPARRRADHQASGTARGCARRAAGPGRRPPVTTKWIASRSTARAMAASSSVRSYPARASRKSVSASG